MRLYRFRGGKQIPNRKNKARYQSIEKMPHVPYVYIPINKNVKRIVKIGEYIKMGQIVAYDEEESYIHSSVSGEVMDIEKIFMADGREEKVIKIKNDMTDTWEIMEKYPDYENLTRDQLVEIVKKAGILGMGGAMFPTFKKLKVPEGRKLSLLIANGCECEPYLNADNRLMQEKSKEITEGIKIIKSILGIDTAVIAIEAEKKEAIFSMKKQIKSEEEIRLAQVKEVYPQGGEKQLIKTITNKELSKDTLPYEEGILVLNVATLYAVYDAVVNGKALVERVVTIAGGGVEEGKNLRIKIGTLIEDILNILEFSKEKTERLVVGGPMTGAAQYNYNTPILKGTNGILALGKKDIGKVQKVNCTSCGSCVRRCPAGLVPLEFDRLVDYGEYKKLLEYSIGDCIECGMCSYTCPSYRPILESIKFGKKMIKELNLDDQKI